MAVEKFFQHSAVATQLVIAQPGAKKKCTQFCSNKGNIIKVNVYIVFIEMFKEYCCLFNLLFSQLLWCMSDNKNELCTF